MFLTSLASRATARLTPRASAQLQRRALRAQGRLSNKKITTMASPDEFAALAPAIKLKDGAHGYLITLAEPNAWWKVNSATEAVALLRMAWSELNGESTAMPNLVPHAILDAPGALFVEQTNDEAADKGDPVSVAHQIMEDVLADPLKGHVGEHLVRLVPVEDTCGNAAAEVTALAQRISHKHFPASGQPLFFAVRPELHSPRLMDTTVNDLVRRVADTVPPIHRVELSPNKTHKTIVLECVGQNTMMSVVDDWHAMHKYNLRELRKEAQQQAY